MKIPKTTKDKPYIEFRIYPNGRIKLSASSSWWGGKKHSFFSSNGTVGNTCEPEKLAEYIEAFKKERIRKIESEISKNQRILETFKKQSEKWKNLFVK